MYVHGRQSNGSVLVEVLLGVLLLSLLSILSLGYSYQAWQHYSVLKRISHTQRELLPCSEHELHAAFSRLQCKQQRLIFRQK